MINFKNLFLCIAIGFYSLCFSQEQFSYKRKINIENYTTWNRVEIPISMFQKLNTDLSDIRIYHFKENQKQEIPYLVSPKLLSTNNNISFNILNQTKTDFGYYITLETTHNIDIENINLNFSNQNFDWKINLEGSHNQNQWFTILKNYRIFSFKNNDVDYQFQKLSFNKTNYKFYRIHILSKNPPKLEHASFPSELHKNIETHKIKINNIEHKINSTQKISIFDFSTYQIVPIHSIAIAIENIDFFNRDIEIQYLSDRIKTEKGWINDYKTFYSGKISSNNHSFVIHNTNNIWAKQFRIIIHNRDNPPLNINSIAINYIKYFIYFNPKNIGDYFIFYGNKNSIPPQYDLEFFSSKILNTPYTNVTLSDDINIHKEIKSPEIPLFKNKFWLWGLLLLITLLLGFSSYKMLSSNKEIK